MADTIDARLMKATYRDGLMDLVARVENLDTAIRDTMRHVSRVSPRFAILTAEREAFSVVVNELDALLASTDFVECVACGRFLDLTFDDIKGSDDDDWCKPIVHAPDGSHYVGEYTPEQRRVLDEERANPTFAD